VLITSVLEFEYHTKAPIAVNFFRIRTSGKLLLFNAESYVTIFIPLGGVHSKKVKSR